MILDIDKLEQSALAATQGEWKTLDIQSQQPQIIVEQGKNWNNPTICNFYDDVTPEDSVTCGNWYESLANHEANATHIAAANPSAVLELITRLRAAEKDAARYCWLRNPDQDVGNVIDKRIGTPHDITGVWEYRAGDELDNAIDAAMKDKP